MKSIVALCLLWLCLPSSRGQTLESIKADYDVVRIKLEAGWDKTRNEANAAYVKYLKDYMAYHQKRGALERILEGRTELRRFEVSHTWPDQKNENIPEAFRKKSADYNGILKSKRARWDQLYLRMTNQYLGRLGALVDVHTRAKRVDDALVVRREAERVRQSEPYRTIRANAIAHQKSVAAQRKAAFPNAVVRTKALYEDNFSGQELGNEWELNHGSRDLSKGVFKTPLNNTRLTLNEVFEGDFSVEVDVFLDGNRNHSGWDFAIRLPRANGEVVVWFEGDVLHRIQYKSGERIYNKNKNITLPGTLTLIREGDQIIGSFKSNTGNSFELPPTRVREFDETNVVISVAGHSEDAMRGVDRVRVTKLKN